MRSITQADIVDLPTEMAEGPEDLIGITQALRGGH